LAEQASYTRSVPGSSPGSPTNIMVDLDKNMSDEKLEETKSIENIEIDDVAVIDEFCTKVGDKTEREKLDATNVFLQTHLKNALSDNAVMPKDVKERIWDQDTPKKLSQVFSDKYGVCLEWHAAGKAVLDKLGIETVFRVGTVPDGPTHTYLDVKIDGNWEVFDPFAEQYIKELGGTGKRFQKEYYKNSNAKIIR
jgi:hypothetical protein